MCVWETLLRLIKITFEELSNLNKIGDIEDFGELNDVVATVKKGT